MKLIIVKALHANVAMILTVKHALMIVQMVVQLVLQVFNN